MNCDARSRSQRGMTMIEVVAATFVLAVIGGTVARTLSSGFGLWRSNTGTVNLARTSVRAVTKIADVCADAAMSSLPSELLSPGGYDKLAFVPRRSPGGWGDPCTIEWEPDPADPEDGIDNNDNGVIDEGLLVIRYNPTAPNERRSVLARGVAHRLEGEIVNGLDDNGNGLIDERGIAFFLRGKALEIHLTLVRSDGRGGVMTHTAMTCVAIRN